MTLFSLLLCVLGAQALVLQPPSDSVPQLLRRDASLHQDNDIGGAGLKPGNVSQIRPLLSMAFADPAIVIWQNRTYMYATNNLEMHIPMAVTDSNNKSKLGLVRDGKKYQDALPNLPRWALPSYSTIWAPHVLHLRNETFIMYYTALSQGWPASHCVGSATSTTGPEGPFKPNDDQVPMICDSASGGAIDPSGFVDTNGKMYVVYKVDGNSLGGGGMCGNANGMFSTPLMLQEVDRRDGVKLIGKPKKLLDRIPSDGPYVEAPNIVRTADGTYVLFFSSNCYRTAYYNVNYATAKHVEGPYTRASQPLISSGDLGGLYAPGGATGTPNGTRIVFHAQPDQNSARLLYTSEITIGGTGVYLTGGARGQSL